MPSALVLSVNGYVCDEREGLCVRFCSLCILMTRAQSKQPVKTEGLWTLKSLVHQVTVFFQVKLTAEQRSVAVGLFRVETEGATDRIHVD